MKSLTVSGFADACGLTVLTPGEEDRAVTGGYCGDLLSWVMGRAQAGDAWFTVMGNVNAIAVATLADAACIVLTEASPLDDEAAAKARQQGGAVLQSEQNAYQLAVALHALLDPKE